MPDITKTDLMRAIRDEVFAFKESPLYEFRTANKYFPVIGEGSHDAHIMFIGEAPGLNEAKTGKPFCGASGKILDELLKEINLDRKTAYVGNLIKDRPPENRDPTPEEIAMYAPFLDRQIDIIKPKVIATLGRHSMKYIFQKFGLAEGMPSISKIHGKSFTAQASYGIVFVVALYHPAVALYSRSSLPEMKEDMKALVKYL